MPSVFLLLLQSKMTHVWPKNMYSICRNHWCPLTVCLQHDHVNIKNWTLYPAVCSFPLLPRKALPCSYTPAPISLPWDQLVLKFHQQCLPTIKADITLRNATWIITFDWPMEVCELLGIKLCWQELIKLGLGFTGGFCGEQIFPVSSVHKGAFFSLLTNPPGCHSQFQPEDSACTGQYLCRLSPISWQ